MKFEGKKRMLLMVEILDKGKKRILLVLEVLSKRKKRILLVLGILIVCIAALKINSSRSMLNLISKIGKNNSNQEKIVLQPPMVKTLKIGDSNRDSQYVYAGVVQPLYKSGLAFQVGGKIVKKNVEAGDSVDQGTVIMELDSRDIEQNVKNNAALVSAQESRYKLAEDNLKRYEELYKEGVVSRAEYDNYVNSDSTAKDALDQANAVYAQSVNQLSYCKLYADKSGVIGSVDAEEGQVVTAGQKVVTLIQNNELEVEINVPENRIDQLTIAKKIDINFWALPDVKLNGTLREVSPIANDASRTYRVRISLIKQPSSIKIGMSSNVTISGKDSSMKIWIPLAAVYQKDSSPSVWVVKEDKVALKNITIGDFSSDQITVTSGLNEGDVVVTAGAAKLHQGEKVRIGSDN